MKASVQPEFVQLVHVYNLVCNKLYNLKFELFFLATKKEYVDTSAITPNDIMQVLEYFILKMCPELAHPPNNEKPMQNSLFIRIFYDIKNTPPFLRDVIDEIKDKRSDVQLAFTIVPVCGFQSNNDFMSFNGIRHE